MKLEVLDSRLDRNSQIPVRLFSEHEHRVSRDRKWACTYPAATYGINHRNGVPSVAPPLLPSFFP